jgi:hypothetical protein
MKMDTPTDYSPMATANLFYELVKFLDWCRTPAAVGASCGGRRMAETAAHLVDHVIPVVLVRQWVLSVPFAFATVWLTTPAC